MTPPLVESTVDIFSHQTCCNKLFSLSYNNIYSPHGSEYHYIHYFVSKPIKVFTSVSVLDPSNSRGGPRLKPHLYFSVWLMNHFPYLWSQFPCKTPKLIYLCQRTQHTHHTSRSLSPRTLHAWQWGLKPRWENDANSRCLSHITGHTGIIHEEVSVRTQFEVRHQDD